jgi:hypothetical protein
MLELTTVERPLGKFSSNRRNPSWHTIEHHLGIGPNGVETCPNQRRHLIPAFKIKLLLLKVYSIVQQAHGTEEELNKKSKSSIFLSSILLINR